jgi:hypothetical protein
LSEAFAPFATGIDALLMLSGVSLIVLGLLWLVLLAFRSSLLWGFGALLPPLGLLFVLRRWAVARQAVLLGALGFIPLLVGLAMAGSDPQRLDRLLSFDWARREPSLPPELDIRLNGRLDGQRFAPQQGELIDGLLSLREEGEGGARRELRIRLRQPLNGGVRLDVLPEDRAGPAQIELVWQAGKSPMPEVRRLNGGYTLHLDLQPLAPGKLAGAFHLAWPARYHGRLMRLRSARGANAEGRFDGLDQAGRIVLRRALKPPGEVLFRFVPEQVGAIQLLEP